MDKACLKPHLPKDIQAFLTNLIYFKYKNGLLNLTGSRFRYRKNCTSFKVTP